MNYEAHPRSISDRRAKRRRWHRDQKLILKRTRNLLSRGADILRAARPSLKEQPLRLNDVLIMCTAGRPWWHSQDRASATRPSGCSTAHADTRHRAHAGSHMVARTDLALWPVSAFHVALAASPLAELSLWHCSRRAPYGHLVARARTVTSQGGKGKGISRSFTETISYKATERQLSDPPSPLAPLLSPPLGRRGAGEWRNRSHRP